MPFIPRSTFDKIRDGIPDAVKDLIDKEIDKGMIHCLEERCRLLTKVISVARDEIYLAARTLNQFSNPTSVIGMDIYERLRKTHELLRDTVELLEGSTNEKPK